MNKLFRNTVPIQGIETGSLWLRKSDDCFVLVDTDQHVTADLQDEDKFEIAKDLKRVKAKKITTFEDIL